MPLKRVSPAELEGEALRRWYLRSPEEIERERQAAEAQRYRDFFGQTTSAAAEADRQTQDSSPTDSDTLWVAKAYGGFRPVRPGASDFESTLEPYASAGYPGFLPDHASEPESAEVIGVGNPANPGLIKQWERANGRPWPRTEDGRAFHVSHIRAIADGGTNTLDNIEPMHPDEHVAMHRNNGDNARFGKRASIARTFGGRVEPPAHAPKPSRGPRVRGSGIRGPTVRGLGLLGLIPNITGILSGRIRTDTPVHMWNDMLGYSSEDDLPPVGPV